MARKIDLDKPLSEAERKYLVDRERWRDLEYNAEATGGEVPDAQRGVSAQAVSPRIGDQTVTQVPDGSNPAPASLGQRQKAAAEGGAVQLEFESDDRPYEDFRKEELQEQARRRGLSESGNKQALSDRIRAWDEDNSGEEDDPEDAEPEDEDEDGNPDE